MFQKSNTLSCLIFETKNVRIIKKTICSTFETTDDYHGRANNTAENPLLHEGLCSHRQRRTTVTQNQPAGAFSTNGNPQALDQSAGTRANRESRIGEMSDDLLRPRHIITRRVLSSHVGQRIVTAIHGIAPSIRICRPDRCSTNRYRQSYADAAIQFTV